MTYLHRSSVAEPSRGRPRLPLGPEFAKSIMLTLGFFFATFHTSTTGGWKEFDTMCTRPSLSAALLASGLLVQQRHSADRVTGGVSRYPVIEEGKGRP